MAAAIPASQARKRRRRHHLGHASLRKAEIVELALEPPIFCVESVRITDSCQTPA